MRSESVQKILSETPPEVRDKVRKYGDHVVCRDFKLLVREYFQLIDKWKKSRYIYKEEYAQDLERLEKQIRAELSRFTQQEIEELPFLSNDET